MCLFKKAKVEGVRISLLKELDSETYRVLCEDARAARTKVAESDMEIVPSIVRVPYIRHSAYPKIESCDRISTVPEIRFFDVTFSLGEIVKFTEVL